MKKYNSIPQEMQDLKQWGLFKLKNADQGHKAGKIPVNALTGKYASSTDPNTWTDFNTALSKLGKYGTKGLAFFFANGYIGLDLDELTQPKQSVSNSNRVVQTVMKKAGKPYIERSQSGTGIHAIFKGKLPAGAKNKQSKSEIYERDRFFALTGDTINAPSELPTLNDLDMARLYDTFFTREEVTTVKANRPGVAGNNKSLSEIMRMAKNDSTFQKLMKGDIRDYDSDESVADFALAVKCLYYTDHDIDKAREIMESSSLVRDKWYEKHGKDTYLNLTLTRADAKQDQGISDNKPQYSVEFKNNVESSLDTGGKKRYSMDDMGRSQFFVDLYGQDLRFNYDIGAWHIYHNGVWKSDNKTEAKINQLAEKAANQMDVERFNVGLGIYATTDKMWLKEQAKFIHESRSLVGQNRMILKSRQKLAVDSSEFDKDIYALCIQDGYINLKSGKHLNPDKLKMFSKQATVRYDPHAKAPLWDSFLKTTFSNDFDLIKYVQKAVGYSLTGSTEEQVMFVLLGRGRNGKSVFMNLIYRMLGDYATSLASDQLLAKSNNNPDQANPAIAQLNGARFVTSSEPNKAFQLDTALIKLLTGGENIKARALRENPFEFKPQFKLWLAANHRPYIKGNDFATWRRIKTIPFNNVIPESEVNKHLEDELFAEAPGIFNWIIQGLTMYLDEGLEDCATVAKANEDYRQDMDEIEEFISTCFDKGDSFVASTKEAYHLYFQYAKEDLGQNKPMLKRNFKTEMEEHGFPSKHRNNGDFYIGIQPKEIASATYYQKGLQAVR